ncbi:MAG TPA: cobyrinate a,c-diamide synthase [Bauldia sp.]|nr:cobyrinate a,c-diamide synthase [Bauldia sp.]
MTARALMIAAPASGAGKTVLTAGLLRAFRRRGLAVRGAKSGPDYIDPAFHAAASGADCANLDSWAMAPALLDAILADLSAEADLLLIEAAMGLFDGLPEPAGRRGAAADLAARYRLPVVLVLDASGQTQSAAAVVRGFASHDGAVGVAGVILNRVATERHRAYMADAIAAIDVPVLGALGRSETFSLPSRHLGLVQAAEHGDLAARLDRIAEEIERAVDLDALLALATAIVGPAPAGSPALPPPGGRIALARDDAFSFVYPHIIKGWRTAGATIVPFSPLADQPPPEDCDCCWLPGGYPELHAGRLAAAHGFREGLRRFAETRPVHGECGGYMVLGEELQDAEGMRHGMAALLGHSTSFAERRLTLGYREALVAGGSVTLPPNAVIRGHEFHYATLTGPGGDEPLAEIRDGLGRSLGPAGGRRGQVSGTFFHAIAAA